MAQGTSFDVEHLGDTPFVTGHGVGRYRLPNGLKVLFVREASAPVFSYQTWFQVGARDDADGITGVAHLFEHMMFKATRTRPEGEFMRRLEAAGAPDVNAWTWNDETVYLQSLPAGHLELIAELEADRMQNLALTEATFETERQVVINERRLRVENDPYGLLNERLWRLAFECHPYGRPVIGWRADLDRIGIEDCRRFYRNFYSPTNATVIVVGDLAVEEVLAAVSRHYGAIAGVEPMRPACAPEPEQTAYRSEQVELAAETEILMCGVKVPPTADPDYACLLLLDRVLFGGRSSRLYRRLVDQGLAARTSALLPMFRDPSLYDITVVMRPGRTAREAEAIVFEEFADLAARPVSAPELAAARNQLKASLYGHFKENRGIADFLGIFEMATPGFEHGLEVLEAIDRLDGEALMEAAGRHLRAERASSAFGQPHTRTAAAPASGTDGADGGATAHRPFAFRGAPRPIPTPGGGRVFVVPESSPPLVRASVLFHAGAILDPPGREGLAFLASRMLARGTARRDKDRFEEAVDALGGSLETHAGPERVVIEGEALAETWEPLADLLEEALVEPVFPEAELAKLKDETRARLVEMRNHDRSLGTLFHEAALFGSHPYGRPTLGTPASLDRITRDDAIAFHRRFLGENSALVGVAGAVEAGPAQERLQRLLAAIGPREAATLQYGDRPRLEGRRLLLVDKPDRSQTYVRLGHFGITVNHPDFPALDLANTVFGGGNFNAILFREIREKRGWSYAAGSALKLAREPHTFSLAFSPAVKDTLAAIQLALELFEQLAHHGVDPEALEFARQYTLGTSAFDVNTSDKRLRLAVEQLVLGYDRDVYLEKIRTVTKEEVDAAISRHLDPHNVLITVVCTAADLRDAGERSGAFSAVDVKPYDSLP
ncbi:MAG: insulinase family protein [Planctomycetes bacterium]|nr:insulinase family protein [Planctomycetota bacterium]